MKNHLFALTAFAFSVAAPAGAVTVSNTTPIIVVDGGETSSSIVTTGLAGTISGLTLSLNNFSHTYPDDIVIGLLNQNTGLGFVFWSGIGGSIDVSNISVTFSDAAAGQAPESFVDNFAFTSGTYKPSNFGGYQFNAFTNATSFADYIGQNPNATWTLYVDDVFPADGGSFAGGWSLDFALSGAVPEPANWALMIGGFGFIGATARRRRTSVRFAL
jgi:hypothetical protein